MRKEVPVEYCVDSDTDTDKPTDTTAQLAWTSRIRLIKLKNPIFQVAPLFA